VSTCTRGKGMWGAHHALAHHGIDMPDSGLDIHKISCAQVPRLNHRARRLWHDRHRLDWPVTLVHVKGKVRPSGVLRGDCAQVRKVLRRHATEPRNAKQQRRRLVGCFPGLVKHNVLGMNGGHGAHALECGQHALELLVLLQPPGVNPRRGPRWADRQISRHCTRHRWNVVLARFSKMSEPKSHINTDGVDEERAKWDSSQQRWMRHTSLHERV